MRNYQPTNVDWETIEYRVKNGESTFTIAKDFDVSRQAIDKRARKYGWKHFTKSVTKARSIAEKKTGMQLQPSPRAVAQMQYVKTATQKFDKDTPERRHSLLSLLRQGVPRVHAARSSGISLSTLNRWMEGDKEFGSECSAAESDAVASRLQNIKKAGDKGDWRADSWWLEKTQRETFGQKDSNNNSLAVQINISRGDTDEVINIKPIDNVSMSQD
tara:strand:+ start:866 stop:1513 length:648 start_codon:yes stop_codon:yes gene_type:complete